MATPEKALHVFTTKLASKRRLGETSGAGCSTLKCFLGNEAAQCSITSLRVKNSSCAETSAETSIEKMSTMMEATKETVGKIPDLLLQNVSQSFGKMVDTRLNSVLTLMMTRKSFTGEATPADESIRVASLLSSTKMSPISFASAETKFRPLHISRWYEKKLGRTKAIILPFVFKTIVAMNILGSKSVEVTITAPGTAIGSFVSGSPRIQSVEVTINAEVVHRCMVERCDQAVKECLRTATDILRLANEESSTRRSKNRVFNKKNTLWSSAA